MANPLVFTGGPDWVLQLDVPSIGTNQQLASGALVLNYSGAGLPLANPLNPADVAFRFTYEGVVPPTTNTNRMFFMFG